MYFIFLFDLEERKIADKIDLNKSNLTELKYGSGQLLSMKPLEQVL
jgi:hypothetical protein